MIDRWRQNWNPWHHEFALEMKAGQRHKVKLVWDRIEPAYIALLHLDPLPADEAKDLSIWSEAAQAIDYYVVAGDEADQVLAGYRTLTGKAVLLPKWSYGFWQSRERYKTQAELEMNRDIIWLGVWEKNERAIQFYRKWGFEKFAEHEFVLGDDVQTDWLMSKRLYKTE